MYAVPDLHVDGKKLSKCVLTSLKVGLRLTEVANVLSLQTICTSRNDILFGFSFSIVNDVFVCRPFKKFRKASTLFYSHNN